MSEQFKVGDKVYSLVHGWGEVDRNYLGQGEIEVRFNTIGRMYYNDGKYHSNGEVVLFHDKPTIIPAKKKVKKWRWYSTSLNGQFPFLSAHQTELYANQLNNAVKVPGSEIEVEE